MNEAMIKITDLRKSYGNLDVLKGIDLTIAKLFGRTDRRQYSY